MKIVNEKSKRERNALKRDDKYEEEGKKRVNRIRKRKGRGNEEIKRNRRSECKLINTNA